jgi:nucleotide-binding universal stress UspA family protein
MATPGTVVVGVDGHEPSLQALSFALAEAQRRDADLDVVMAFDVLAFSDHVDSLAYHPSIEELTQAIEADLRHRVREARSAAEGALDGVRVRVAAVAGQPRTVLVGRSHDAELLVLGHRGRSAVASAVLGSVGLACMLHAECPVTVVPAAKAA